MAIHFFRSTSEAYDLTQTDDKYRSGDILIVRSERVVGVLANVAWPTAVTEKSGAFGQIIRGQREDFLGDDDTDWETVAGFFEAERQAMKRGFKLRDHSSGRDAEEAESVDRY